MAQDVMKPERPREQKLPGGPSLPEVSPRILVAFNENRAVSAPVKGPDSARAIRRRRIHSAKRTDSGIVSKTSPQSPWPPGGGMLSSKSPIPLLVDNNDVSTGRSKPSILPRIKQQPGSQLEVDHPGQPITPVTNIQTNGDTPRARKLKACCTSSNGSSNTPFIAMHGGEVKAVVDSGRKSSPFHRPNASVRKLKSLNVPNASGVVSMLPWNDPRRSRKRIPIVSEPPFELKKKRGISVRELAKANQRKKRGVKPKQDGVLPSKYAQILNDSSPVTKPDCLPSLQLPHHMNVVDDRVEEEKLPDPLDQSIKATPPGKKTIQRPPSLNLANLSIDPANQKIRKQENLTSIEPDSAITADIPKAKPTIRIPRDDIDINGGNLDTLSDDLELAASDALEATFEFTSSGAFNIQGFEIQETGITRAPYGKLPNGENTKSGLIKLSVLGKGASGTVHEMLHVPTLSLVAVKSIPCFEQSKRHQMIKELKALYSNLVPISAAGTLPTALPNTGKAIVENGPLLSPPETEENHKRNENQPACPYIVAFHDAFISPREGNISIVMEYMDGGSLQDVVDAGGCDCEDVLANIAECVLRALLFLHNRKQIHRDIKPSNLLINHKGEVKISDFGIVRDVTDDQMNVNTFIGTMIYMSPERINGSPYSFSSDIWSYGLSLMTVALGRFPLSMEGGYWGMLQSLNHDQMPSLPAEQFSPEFIDFVNRCLEKNPADRPSAAQLLDHPFLVNARTKEDGKPKVAYDQCSADDKEKLEEICNKLVEYKVQKLLSSADTPSPAVGIAVSNQVSFSPPDQTYLRPPSRKKSAGGSLPNGSAGGKNSRARTDDLTGMGRCTCTLRGKCTFCMTSSFGNELKDNPDPEKDVAQGHQCLRISKVSKQECSTLADQIGLPTTYVRSRLNGYVSRGNEYLRRHRLYHL